MGIKCNLTFNIKAAHQLNVWVRKPWGLGKELFFFLVIWSKLFSPLCGWPDLLLSSLFAPQLFICKNEFKKHFRFPPCVKRETYSSHHVLFFHQIFFFFSERSCVKLSGSFGWRLVLVVHDSLVWSKWLLQRQTKNVFIPAKLSFHFVSYMKKKGFLLKKIKEFSLGATWEKTFVKGFLSHCFTHE